MNRRLQALAVLLIFGVAKLPLEAGFSRSFTGLRDGLFKSPVAAIYPLSRLAEALAHQSDPRRDGKILIDPRC